MECAKKLPCWVKVIAAIFAVVFVCNWPSSSGEWAAWMQAFGVIGAIGAGFASSESDRRRSALDELNFLYSAVEELDQILEKIRYSMEVKDPESKVTTVTKPREVNTSEMRAVAELISSRSFHGISFEVIRELKKSTIYMTKYADALDAKDLADLNESWRNTMTIYNIEVPLRSARAALDAINSERTKLENKPFFSF